MPNKPSQFWQELKRRKVIHVITVYAGVAFVVIELINNVTEPLRLPEWTPTLVIIILLVGFPLAVIFSWIYDIHPEKGIVKTEQASNVKTDQTSKSSNSWKIATYVSIVIITGLLFMNIVSGRKRIKDLSVLEKSIAVLPFENWNSDEEYAHMGDAIANEINTQLAKIHAFHIISYTSSSQYKGSDKPPTPQIGRELDVNFIIEGTIERQKEDVSIHVQVIQTDSDDHLWAEEFKGKWDNIFAIRAEIAVKIAEELRTVLSHEEIENIEKKPTENTEAFNLYLRGRYFWNNRDEESLLKSIDFFNQAVELDSNYALAYIGLADSYSMLPWYVSQSDPSYFIKAEQAALKALEIDDSSAEVHASLGYVYFNAWEFESAEKEFLKAIDLDPEYATAHHWYAMLLSCYGRFDKAIEEIIIAHNLEPLSLVISRNVGVTYLYARQYDETIEALNKVIEIDPDFPHITGNLVSAYLYKGMYKEALSLIQKSEYSYLGLKGIIYVRMGNLDEANKILDELVLLSEAQNSPYVDIAILQFSLGYIDEGFNNLEKLYESHDLGLTWIITEPEIDPYRSDPRFIDLLYKMGLGE